ncbi:transposase [Streptomyces sp. NPDC048361]|uniref:transposase n=1 Tax=Streptomyces sp. NPDC048361 TaxID=3154720 RepID=UPI0034436782
MQLTDTARDFSEPCLPVGEYGPHPERLRRQFEGVIGRFRTVGQWREMPSESGAWSTVSHRACCWSHPRAWWGSERVRRPCGGWLVSRDLPSSPCFGCVGTASTYSEDSPAPLTKRGRGSPSNAKPSRSSELIRSTSAMYASWSGTTPPTTPSAVVATPPSRV